MGVSYAVSWQEPGIPVECGRLELHPNGILFQGANAPRKVAFDVLASVRISRSAEDRRNGGPTLVLERRDAGSIQIGSLDRPGVVLELAERLAVAARG